MFYNFTLYLITDKDKSLNRYILHIRVYACAHTKLLQSCLTLCDPMNYCPPGFSVRCILHARILEWVAIIFSRGPSDPGIEPTSPTSAVLTGKFFTSRATWETHMCVCVSIKRLIFLLNLISRKLFMLYYFL